MAPPSTPVGNSVGAPTVLEKDQRLSLVDQMAQVPKFSGNNPYYSLKSFIKDFEEWAEFFQWGEKDKFFILKKRLEGRAHEIFEVHEENIKTCKQLFDKLNERLSAEVTPDEKLRSLWSFRQTPEMPVADFISLARKKAVAAANAHNCTKDKVEDAVEEWLLSTLCNNILPQYRMEILRKKPKTTKDFEEIALIEESAWKATAGIVSPDSVNCHALSNSNNDKMLSLLEEVNSKMHDLALKVDRLEKEKKEGVNKPDLTEINCYRCGRQGHLARECRSSSQFTQNYTARGRGSNYYKGNQQYRGNNFRGQQSNQRNNFRGAHQFQNNRPNFNTRGNQNFRGNSRGRGENESRLN